MNYPMHGFSYNGVYEQPSCPARYDTVIVDGMLKDHNSICSSMSEFSRKGSREGSRDTSIIYAYPLDENGSLMKGNMYRVVEM